MNTTLNNISKLAAVAALLAAAGFRSGSVGLYSISRKISGHTAG